MSTLERVRWAEHLVGVLDAMPQHFAAPVRLSYFEQLPEQAIANRLGISVAEARSALMSGLRIIGRAPAEPVPA